jgi:hypothetical protein
LIVVGVVAVIGGASRYYDTVFYGNEILSMNAAVAAEANKYGLGKLVNMDYRGLIQREKLIAVVSVLLGISFAVLGTFMIKDQKKPSYDSEEDDDVKMSEDPRFRL